jgi:D-arabinose 5-phosphate isomerase GutQ
MILVTVEMLPSGSKAFRHTIAIMTIANMSDLAETSDYRVELVEGANPISMSAERSTFATVLDHDRRQSVWTLVSKAIARSLESFNGDRDR